MRTGRPPKSRTVEFVPEVTYFKPAGIPLRVLEEVRLSVEEAEAIRLKDLQGLEQEECAGKMNISRPTFQRVLKSAREKVADSLLNGKAIRIEGGNFELALRRLPCVEGHECDVPLEAALSRPSLTCSTCDVPNIVPLRPVASSRGRRNGGGRRRTGPAGRQAS